MPTQTLSFLGCGNVGKALGRRWVQANVFTIGQVLTRSLTSAEQAVAFLESGQAIHDFSEIEPADAFFLAAPDDVLAGLAQKLAATGMIVQGAICWHASGAVPSTILKPLAAAGAQVASLHPLKSFADPGIAAQSFPGTPCVIEGAPEVTALLGEAIRAIGGEPICLKMNARDKAIYHAGTILASNGLVALAELAALCLEQAGMNRQQALQLLHPLMAGSVENLGKLGTTGALTGPISRGDVGTIARHLAALEGLQTLEPPYRTIGQLIVALARKQDHANPQTLNAIQEMLRS
jgi:predicted short-subunit dehydrogenase-like oxidoreductase (DUF2520 family)